MKKNIQFLVTVTTVFDKGMTDKEITEVAQSVIGKNGCWGAGAHGEYSAEVKTIRKHNAK